MPGFSGIMAEPWGLSSRVSTLVGILVGLSPLFDQTLVVKACRSARGYAPDQHDEWKERSFHMPLYEHVFLARQDASSAQVEQLTKEFSDILEEAGGKVARSEHWGLKSLAYKIKKSRKAHYTMLNLDAPAAAVNEMERRMRLSTDIIRFMTIRVDELETEPSVMMRKQDRDDRGGRGGPRGGDRDRRGGGPRGPRGPRPDRPDREPRDNPPAGE